MLRREFKRILAVLLAAVTVFLLCACTTTLSGTYTAQEGLVEQSFTFEKDNKVKMSAFGVEIEGEYEIKDDEIVITYSLLNFSYDFVKPFKKDGKSIYIDGVEFVKEK